MSLVVETAGLQTLVEGRPRRGWRHLGVPAAGAADPLSLALANRLVGNALDAAGLEITLSGASLKARESCVVAVTGATCSLTVGGREAPMHRRLELAADTSLQIGPAETGVRSYLAVAGGIAGVEVLGSVSTYLPARLGGFEGRALCDGDVLETGSPPEPADDTETPAEFRFAPLETWTLRAVPGAEFDMLEASARQALFDDQFRIGARNDRMGAALDGAKLAARSEGSIDSAPVFPGTVQCPEAGQPYLLGVDAQTTGGYPRVAEVIRADRYLIGQLRTGTPLRFLERDADTALAEFESVHRFWGQWLPGIESIL